MLKESLFNRHRAQSHPPPSPPPQQHDLRQAGCFTNAGRAQSARPSRSSPPSPALQAGKECSSIVAWLHLVGPRVTVPNSEWVSESVADSVCIAVIVCTLLSISRRWLGHWGRYLDRGVASVSSCRRTDIQPSDLSDMFPTFFCPSFIICTPSPMAAVQQQIDLERLFQIAEKRRKKREERGKLVCGDKNLKIINPYKRNKYSVCTYL